MKLSYLMYEPVPDLAELDRRMGLLAGLGYEGIELVATHPLGFEAGHLAECSERRGLPVVSWLSGWSYANEGLCLSRPEASIRDRAVARLGDYIRLAKRFGSLVVIGLMQGLRTDEPDEAVANDRIAESLRKVASIAESEGVRLVLEPVNHQQVGFNNSADEAAAMATRVGSPALGYMLDTIHMNVEERSIIGTIRKHGPVIGHFHLCESNGGPLGSGNIDFPGAVRELRDTGYQGYLSVKVYRKATWDEAARHSIEFLRPLGLARSEGS